jgi:ATP-dependent Lhr-like helicase
MRDGFDLDLYHPVIAGWFRDKFGQPTDVQHRAWAHIMPGEHTLIASPTGSGKTLAALLPCIDRIAKRKLEETGEGAATEQSVRGVRLLYITPLKALNNDIDHHLEHFLREMEEKAVEMGAPWPEIRVGVRTGDTAASTRASMLKRPPDVLITTPESFYILMTSEKARHMLRTVEQVIVDEIHDLASGKRGAHLTLTLERLVEWCGRVSQRIGVSATQKPLERVAAFLGGWDDAGERRPVRIVESLAEKKFELLVTMPDYSGLSRRDKENVWIPLVERVLQLMGGSSTALIFVNNRRLCERLTLRLNDHVGYEMARSHHGSISREQRLGVERMLKRGELRCLVATSSLELGIDVGHVDLVVQIDSPKQAAAGIQRIGRAGHSAGGVSRGVILARSRGELAEAAVLSRQIAARDIEEIRIPRNSLDVLSQQAVAMVATDDWEIGRLHAVVTRSDCFRSLARGALEALLAVLAGFFPFARPLIEWDRETGRLHRRSGTGMAELMGAGTIPQSSGYPVHHLHSRIHLGELEEEFVHESRVGDVFQLGTASWTIQSIKHDRLYVTETANRFSEIPFWRGEAGGRSYELGCRVGALLRELVSRTQRAQAHMSNETSQTNSDTLRDNGESGQAAHTNNPASDWLRSECFLDTDTSSALVTLIQSQKAASAVPTDRTVVVEHFTDEMNQVHMIIHSVFGRRFNRTWELALKRHYEKILPFTIQSFVKEDGIEFIFSEWDDSWLGAVWQISSSELKSLLLEALPSSPLFGISFRRLAETSLLLSRGFTRVPAWKKRFRSEELLKEAMPYAERFPLLREAMEECMNEWLDVANVSRFLQQIERGEIEVAVKKTMLPSPLAGQFMADFVNQKMYESDAFGKDLQFQLFSFNKELAADWFGTNAAAEMMDPEVIARERIRLEGMPMLTESVSPDANITDAEALYRLLKERGDMTSAEIRRFVTGDHGSLLRSLVDRHRIAVIHLHNEERYICRDELDTYASWPSEASLSFVLNRYIDHRMSFTADDLQQRYGLTGSETGGIIAAWREHNRIERAPFAGEPVARESRHNALPHIESDMDKQHWSSRKVVSRIVRYSMNYFHRQTQPLDPAAYCSQLLAVHHLEKDAKLQGTDGLKQVISRLQGVFLPVSYWENIIFPARMHGYRKEDLDLLCAAGEVFWLGQKNSDGEKEGKIAFFLTEAKELYTPWLAANKDTRHPELLERIRGKGASFLSVMSRETGMVPSELLDSLLDLVWEGHISNDQFAPLRLHAKPAASRNGKGKSGAFQSGLGRWYALDSLYDSEVKLEACAAGWAHHLLQSCGLITRQIASELAPFSWDTMLGVLKRLEEWGMVARGLFVDGIPSVQFASKEMIAKLRNHARRTNEGSPKRKGTLAAFADSPGGSGPCGPSSESIPPSPSNPSSESIPPSPSNPSGKSIPSGPSDPSGASGITGPVVLLSAVDPVNPYGNIVPWPEIKGVKFARKPGNYLVMQGGEWKVWIENNGRRIYRLSGDLESRLQWKSIFSALLGQQGLRKIVIDTWNGTNAADDTPAASLLTGLGAERDRSSFVLWLSSMKS